MKKTAENVKYDDLNKFSRCVTQNENGSLRTYNQFWREDQLLCRVQRQKVALIKQLWLHLEDVVKAPGGRKQAQEGETGIYY